MKAYFYTSPVKELDVAMIATDKTPEQLKKEAVFSDETVWLKTEFNEHCSTFVFVDLMQFDDTLNPTKVVINRERATAKYIEECRLQRAGKLETLDSIAVRAISQQRDDILEMVERDKQVLRDLPENIDTSAFTELAQFLSLFPVALNINYYEKYNEIFNAK